MRLVLLLAFSSGCFAQAILAPIFQAPPAGGGGGPAFVQQQTGNNAFSGTLAITLTSTPVNGDVLVVMLTTSCSDTPTPSVSSTGTTWSSAGHIQTLDSGNTRNYNTDIWVGSVGAGASSTVTIASNSGSTFTILGNVQEYSNVLTTVDVAAVTNTGTSTTPTSASYTPLTSNDLVLTATTYVSGTAASGHPASPFVTLTDVDDGTSGLSGSYIPGASTIAYTPSWTVGSSVIWNTVTVGLKP